MSMKRIPFSKLNLKNDPRVVLIIAIKSNQNAKPKQKTNKQIFDHIHAQ